VTKYLPSNGDAVSFSRRFSVNLGSHPEVRAGFEPIERQVE
jgi:hypothetical protein